jgi:hypothetical protein
VPLQSVETKTPPSPLVFRLLPSRVSALLGPDGPTSLTALGGSAYNFHTRPFQYSRPLPIRLDRFQTAAVTTELRRLRTECYAVEPEHDGDKAIMASAPSWERIPLRMGQWPRERRTPVFTRHSHVILYNRQGTTSQHRRRA